MPGSTKTIKLRFHQAVSDAVETYFGNSWSRFSKDNESWGSRYLHTGSDYLRGVDFRLINSNHMVDVTLTVSQRQSGKQNIVWWDDRSKNLDASGFKTVLWAADLRYAEKHYSVPKDFLSDNFISAIDDMVKDVLHRSDSWFRMAEAELDARKNN